MPIRTDPAVAAYHRERAAAAFAALDEQLGAGGFLVGDALTIADLCCYGDVAFARMSDLDLAHWPNVTRWAASIEARPGFGPPLELLPMADAEVAA